MKFVDRERELSLLKDIYNRHESQMIVLYGRRRIGKTALITHWLHEHIKHDCMYWVAYKSSSDMLLDKFSKVITPCLDGVDSNVRFVDWDAALRQIFRLAEHKKVVLAIDEFPYLLESVPEFPSILQMLWDQHAKTSQFILLLSGSHYHMMFQEFVSGKGPLYGRSTADMLLEEIAPSSMHLFLPRYSPEQIVETYSLIGGVPKYLEMWDDRRTVFKNIEEIILSPVTIFRQEAIFLIQDEISEPRTYLAILEAIGRGLKTPSAIAKLTGIAINHLGKYLHTLRELGFVRRVISLDAADYAHTRTGRYEIKDSYLKFYFHYLYPHLELLEQQRISRLMALIKAQHESFVGKTGFEELARRFITKIGDDEQLSFVPDYIGRIWSKQVEIDVVAINKQSRNILLGECKWSREKMGMTVLDRLIEKSAALPKIQRYHKHYALFSKNGFTSSVLERAVKERIFLFQGAGFERIN